NRKARGQALDFRRNRATQGRESFTLDLWQEPTLAWADLNPGRRFRRSTQKAIAKRERDRERAHERRKTEPKFVGYDPRRADIQTIEGVSRTRAGGGGYLPGDRLGGR